MREDYQLSQEDAYGAGLPITDYQLSDYDKKRKMVIGKMGNKKIGEINRELGMRIKMRMKMGMGNVRGGENK